MNDQDIAKLLATSNGPSIYDLPKFLSTAAGRNAVRGAVDQAIAAQRVTNTPPQPMSQQIIKSLLASIGSNNGNPMQTVPSNNPQNNLQGSPEAANISLPKAMQNVRGGY